MADEEINDQTSKAADADLTDELHGQTSANGVSFKATARDIMAALVHTRGLVDGGFAVQTGALNVLNVAKVSNGVFDWYLETPVTNLNTIQMFVSPNITGGGIKSSISMISTTVVRTMLSVSGIPSNVSHTILLFDEA